MQFTVPGAESEGRKAIAEWDRMRKRNEGQPDHEEPVHQAQKYKLHPKSMGNQRRAINKEEACLVVYI